MPGLRKQYGSEVQHVSNDTPLEDILYLIKRDGAVFVKDFVSEGDVDKAREDIEDRLDNDPAWDGSFFPSQNFQINTPASSVFPFPFCHDTDDKARQRRPSGLHP